LEVFGENDIIGKKQNSQGHRAERGGIRRKSDSGRVLTIKRGKMRAMLRPVP